MLNKTQLRVLKKTDEFSSVFRFRNHFSNEALVTHYRSNNKAGVRFGFVVAKKIAKRAVDRNYMRRVLRELCKQEQRVLDNVDIVIQVKKPFKHNSFFLIKDNLTALFSKIQKKLIARPDTNA